MAADRPLRIAMISYYLPSESKIGVGYQVHALATELARGRRERRTPEPRPKDEPG